MSFKIGPALSNIEQKEFSPAKKTFISITEKPEVLMCTKDEKKLSETSSQPSKSKHFDFVDENNKHLNLYAHKVISTTSKVIGEEIGKKITEKTVVRSVGKVATTVAKTSGEAFGKTLLKSIGINTVQTALTSGAEVLTLKTIEKSAAKTAEKGGAELSKRISGAVPVVGAILEIGFTLWDAKYAYDLTKDKNVSTVSKALAWATVGLDVVSTITVATGVGSPIGWAATGLGIGTAVLSDMLK